MTKFSEFSELQSKLEHVHQCLEMVQTEFILMKYGFPDSARAIRAQLERDSIEIQRIEDSLSSIEYGIQLIVVKLEHGGPLE